MKNNKIPVLSVKQLEVMDNWDSTLLGNYASILVYKYRQVLMKLIIRYNSIYILLCPQAYYINLCFNGTWIAPPLFFPVNVTWEEIKQKKTQRPLWLSHSTSRLIFPGVNSREILQPWSWDTVLLWDSCPEIMVLNHMVQDHYTLFGQSKGSTLSHTSRRQLGEHRWVCVLKIYIDMSYICNVRFFCFFVLQIFQFN